jgi:L-fuconolactonase
MVHHGLVFDALVKPVHLSRIQALTQRHPQLRVVIDHGAKPSLDVPLSEWTEGLRAIALATSAQQVACKLSGLWTELPAGADSDALTPWCEVLMSVWGPHRLIWGSDWPVLNLAADYPRWHAWSVNFLRKRCAPDSVHDVLGNNAMRIYQLDSP